MQVALISSGVSPAVCLEGGNAGFAVVPLGCRELKRHGENLKFLTHLSADGSSQPCRALGQSELCFLHTHT